jgi:hypothetical protein
MDIERRFRRLERSNRIKTIALSIVVLGGVALAAAPDQDVIKAREIVLSHPEGKSTITLRADPNVSGLWINDGSTDNGSVAIFSNSKNHEAVVGAYGPKQRRDNSLDVCLATTDRGPVIQMAGQRKLVLTPTNWQPQLSQQGSDFDIKFVAPNANSGTRRVNSGQ